MANQPQSSGGLLLAKWALIGKATAAPSLGRVALAVLWQLCERYNHDTGAAWPSFNRLAKDTGASARQVKRAVADLERAGLIAIVERGDRVRSNRYRPRFKGGATDGTRVVSPMGACSVTDGTDVVSPMALESIYQSGHKAEIDMNGICERHERPQAPPDGACVAADATPARWGASDDAADVCEGFWRHFPKRLRVAEAEKLLTAITAQSVGTALEVLQGAEAYARYVAAKQISTSYQLSPETFIRDQRYRDDWDQLRRDHVAEGQRQASRKAPGSALGAGKRRANNANKPATKSAPQRAPALRASKVKRNTKGGW